MRIGEFTKTMKTTRDTVRHYEDLKLLTPEWQGNRKTYREQDVKDFKAIAEMKQLGLTLKDIELIFQLKRTYGCGSPSLVQKVLGQFSVHLDSVKAEEKQIRRRRRQLEAVIKELEAIE
ncbi:MAG TPA: MerR family transcriptional regulator [Bacillales bacterium]|nr:MerR family transcriptional regulator [Bacillales bacterium]